MYLVWKIVLKFYNFFKMSIRFHALLAFTFSAMHRYEVKPRPQNKTVAVIDR